MFQEATTAADFLAIWLNNRLLSPESQKIVDDYYRNFRGLVSTRMRHWYNQQVADAEAIVRGKSGLRMLEIGVGSVSGLGLRWSLVKAQCSGRDMFLFISIT